MAIPRHTYIAIGDSLTYGYTQNATPYPERLATLIGDPVVNMGVGGDKVVTARARWDRYVEPWPYKGTILCIGTNDLALDSMTAVTLWADVLSWILAIQAASQTAIVITVPPRDGSSSWDATKEQERLDFNQSAIDYAQAHPEVLLVNSDTLLGTGSPVALRGAIDYGDHLHLNGTGMQDLAAAVATLLGF